MTSLSSMEDRWTPPPIGVIEANFDTVIRPNFAVAATIFHDRNGAVLHHATKVFPPCSALEGEAQAALFAVKRLVIGT